MRQANVIRGDIVFQWKYGFYLLYLLVIMVYMIIFSFFSGNIRNIVVSCCVYSDPAAMGMFFMGALILLEKSQHITSSIVVSPVTPTEYISGKVFSFGLISVIVGIFLILFGHTDNYLLCAFGILAARQVMMPAALFLFSRKRCCYAENVEKAQRGMVAVSERARKNLLQHALSEVQK